MCSGDHFCSLRRPCAGGRLTGPCRSGNRPFQASVGFIPAEPQLVRDGPAIGLFRLPSGLSRRSHDWSATVRQSAFSGFRRVYPGGATTGPLSVRQSAFSGFRRVYPGGATTGPLRSGNRPFQASVGFIPAEPQLVRYGPAIRLFRLPSGLSRRSHNWSATVRQSVFSGFRRVYPGGATTGPLPTDHDTPSVESPACHHTGTQSRPNQAAACFGLDGTPLCL